MALTIKEFWQIVLKSRLFSQSTCEKWAVRCAQELGGEKAAQPDQVAEYLIGQKVLSRYQAKVLLSGSVGPFFYGDYRVFDRVEKGRQAGSFRAHHAASRYPVLLHFLTGPIVQSPVLWNQFVAWIQANVPAAHPCLVRWFELCDLGSFKFLVTEDVRGRPWDEPLTAGKALRPDAVAKVLFDAVQGLAELHQRGLVHGDVRPLNLWNDLQGGTRLLRSTDEIPGPISAATPDLLARSDYLGPEFLQPGRAPDPLSDLYALGCSAYQLLTGSVPFPGGDVGQKLQRHASEPIRPLEPFGVPPGLIQVVAYLMAKNPEVRFQRAENVLEQLSPWVAAPSSPAAPPPTLAAFEKALEQKQATVAAAAPSPVTLPTPAPAPLAAVTVPAVTFPSPGPAAATAVEGVAPAFNLRVEPDTGPILRKRKPVKRKWLPLVASIVSVVVVLGAIGVAVMLNQAKNSPQVASSPGASGGPGTPAPSPNDGQVAATGAGAKNGAAVPGNGGSKTADSGAGVVVVPDDGKLLWASPTAGQEIDFKYLPSGAQFILFARPADLEGTPEGPRVLKALGPGLEAALKQWEDASGLTFGQAESLIVSLHGGDDGIPRPALVVRLREPMPAESLLEKWGNPPAKASGKLTSYEAKGWAFLLPPDEEDRVLVMCAPSEMADVLERGGAAPPDHRWIGRLRRASDRQRHVTIFCTPQNLRSDLLRDGRQWSWGDVRRARECVDWFLGDATQAAMISLHLDDECYVELRIAGEIGRDRYTLASDLRTRLAESPELVESFMVAVNPPPYWRAVAFRFPGMIRFLHSQTRIGVEDEHALLNAVLPVPAGHNLLFGTSMALLSSPGATAVAVTAPGKTAGPKTFDELLGYKFKVDIPQQDLVNALVDIERSVNEEVKTLPYPFKIKMMGNDLKVDGITQNQKIVDFKMENQSLSDILTGLVRKANPDPSVKDASEPGQKLIWVVALDPDEKSRQAVLVTTRAGAERDGFKLPAPFVAKP